MPHPLPPIELLESLFSLDTTSPSGLRWKNPPKRGGVKPGDVAGSLNTNGYWRVKITTDTKKLYLCHRIIYFLRTKKDPGAFEIDHIFGDIQDSSNLRLADRQQNAANRCKNKKYKNKPTSSQYKGVCWFKRDKKWLASIRIDNKNKHLGLFESEREAAAAYNQAAIDAFGDFAYLNEI